MVSAPLCASSRTCFPRLCVCLRTSSIDWLVGARGGENPFFFFHRETRRWRRPLCADATTSLTRWRDPWRHFLDRLLAEVARPLATCFLNARVGRPGGVRRLSNLSFSFASSRVWLDQFFLGGVGCVYVCVRVCLGPSSFFFCRWRLLRK